MKSRNRCEGRRLFVRGRSSVVGLNHWLGLEKDWLLRALLPESIGTARLDVRTVAR